MSFKRMSGGHELADISTLLTLFGVVEEEQMRRLFSHLTDSEYGKIMAKMNRENMIVHSADAKLMAGNGYALKKFDPEERALCFEVFIYCKDRIQDYCRGTDPALITIAAADATYDIIPVSEENLDFVNRKSEDLDEKVVRFLAVQDVGIVEGIQRRYKNDYLFCLKADRELGVYEL